MPGRGAEAVEARSASMVCFALLNDSGLYGYNFSARKDASGKCRRKVLADIEVTQMRTRREAEYPA